MTLFKSTFSQVAPDERYKDLVSNYFYEKLSGEHASKVLFVDYASGRQWTGQQLFDSSCTLARALIQHGLAPNDECVVFYKHCDYAQLAALGALFAGAGVCYGYERDPAHEHAYMLDVMQPSFVFVGQSLVDQMLRLRQSSSNLRALKIVIMDDDDCEVGKAKLLKSYNDKSILGLHTDLLATKFSENGAVTIGLPVQVDPNRPAFTLLTSGSTGQPKPVGRSQRNCLHVCHSFEGVKSELWDLNATSVLSAHMSLDHGTGCFFLKQCIVNGCTSIIINGYEQDRMLEAIEKHKITDVILAAPYVHNLLSSRKVLDMMQQIKDKHSTTKSSPLSSLRNIIAVGSSIASQKVARDFMACFGECSVRPAYGMTESGFVAFVPRELALKSIGDDEAHLVGKLLPNVEVRLLARPDERLGASTTATSGQNGCSKKRTEMIANCDTCTFNELGELYVRAPTVSPGYSGAQFAEQARACFLPDGFYKSNDVCSIDQAGNLRVFGRFNEVLFLADGGKMLPAELEQLLATHPLVLEAAVVGVTHPRLPTCHAPRAYVVPREGVKIIEDNEDDATTCSATKSISARQIFQFVADRKSGAKHLLGGVKFVGSLPRISIGKVDKRTLKRQDGLL